MCSRLQTLIAFATGKLTDHDHGEGRVDFIIIIIGNILGAGGGGGRSWVSLGGGGGAVELGGGGGGIELPLRMHIILDRACCLYP